MNVRDVLEDLEGMLGQGDLEVALLRCQDLLGDACEYSLRCLGETNPKRKWGIKLLAKYAHVPFARDVHAQYWNLQFPDGTRIRGDEQAAHAHVRACMTFAERLLTSTARPLAQAAASIS